LDGVQIATVHFRRAVHHECEVNDIPEPCDHSAGDGDVIACGVSPVGNISTTFCTKCGMVKDRGGDWRKPADDDDHARLQTFRRMAIEDAEGTVTYELLYGEDAERFLGRTPSQ
jgi:hypothetical protein